MTITQIWNGWLLEAREWGKDRSEFYLTLAEVVMRINDIEWAPPALRALDDAPFGSGE